MEQFEDNPLEFIRLDFALPGTGASADVTTRREAAAEVLQALVGCEYEVEGGVDRGGVDRRGARGVPGHEEWERVEGEGQRDESTHGGCYPRGDGAGNSWLRFTLC